MEKTNYLQLARHPIPSALARVESGFFLSLALSAKLCNTFPGCTKICIAKVTIFTLCVPASCSSQWSPSICWCCWLPPGYASCPLLSDLSSRAGALLALSGFLQTQHTAVSQAAQLPCTQRKWKNELVVRYCPLEKAIFFTVLTNA